MNADDSLFSKNWLVGRIAHESIAETAPLSRHRLLDVGCGEKPYLSLFEPYVESYVGLEHPDTLSDSKVIDVYGSGLKLPFGDSSFDTVVAFQVLEHVPEPDRMVREMSRVLRDDGHMILTAPHIWGLHEEPKDYFRFTKYGLEYLLEKNGIEVLYIKAMAGYWVTAGQRFCYYLEHFRRRFLIGWLVPFLWLSVQLMALFLDSIHRVESDAWNYIAVGRKRQPR